MPSVAPPAASENAASRIDRLRGVLERNRSLWRSLSILESLGVSLAAPLALLLAGVAADALWRLPVWGRAVAWLAVLGAAIGSYRMLRVRLRGLTHSEDEVALAIEGRTSGGMQNRLINAVQLSRESAGVDDFRDAAIRENLDAIERTRLQEAKERRPALLKAAAVLGVIGIGLAFWVAAPSRFSASASRILLPFIAIDPAYSTVLHVEPGDAEAAGDVPLTIRIEGERPESIAVIAVSQGKRRSETVATAEGEESVAYLLRGVDQDTEYWVRGGDFTSAVFHLRIPRLTKITRFEAQYRFPHYVRAAPRSVQGSVPDLEGLEGTTVSVAFGFDLPIENVRLTTQGKAGHRIELTKGNDGLFRGELVLRDLASYRLDAKPKGRTEQPLGPFAIRVLQDQEPKLDLGGMDRRAELAMDASATLTIQAEDDFGLESLEVAYRRPDAVGSEDDWKQLVSWPTESKAKFRTEWKLDPSKQPWTEGERIELSLRAKDACPDRKGWTVGTPIELTLGGGGAALQLQYETILRAEKELRSLLGGFAETSRTAIAWQRKLEGAGDLRWDDPKNVAALHSAVVGVLKEQESLRTKAGGVARMMPASAGNLRIGLGMLADTEMARIQRILESVPTRDAIPAKQTALADARAALERTERSLQEMSEQYVRFRSDWELSNMIPFVKMLADRQAKLRDLSKRATEGEHVSQSRRQRSIGDLVKLIEPAYVGLSERVREQDELLAQAFAEGGKTLASDELRKPIEQAAAALEAAKWSEATTHQTNAAEQLTRLHERMRKAQAETARRAIAALKEKATKDKEVKTELERLPEGIADALVTEFPEAMKLEDSLRLREVAKGKKREGTDDDLKAPEPSVDLDPKSIELKEDSGVRQDTDTLTLGKEAEKTKFLEMYKSVGFNKVKPFIQEKFDDLIGKLLDETEELGKNYQTIKLSTNQNNNDPGDIGKQGGALNSTGAVAATGNKKPPTTEAGGVARTGRQGARAYGMVADKEGLDMKGRDKALDGMEQAPDQAGTIKNKKTDDPATDFSTGVGGKKVESDDNHFSLHDAGKWKDEMLKRMDKAQKKHYIVERQDGKIDAATAAQLRDLESKQEQTIERLKSIRKELKNLYLPTDHLDDLQAQLRANLERLKESPDPELFRLQMQTLDRLRGAIRVFGAAGSRFQPSLPRERAVQGRVLDSPAVPPIPGYQEALKNYYLRLAEQ